MTRYQTMSAGRKYGSQNIHTGSSKGKILGAKFGPASGSAEQDTDAGSPPTLTNGATLHRCEYCQDLAFKFGHSKDEIQRIVRSLVDDESLWRGYVAVISAWINRGRAFLIGKTFLILRTDRVRSGVQNGCLVFEAALEGHYHIGTRYSIFGVELHISLSSLRFTGIDDFRAPDSQAPGHWFPVFVSAGKSSMFHDHAFNSGNGEAKSISLTSNANSQFTGSPLSDMIVKRPVNKYTWSERTTSQVKHWMQQCNENHTLCSSEEGNFSPLNLIEISKSTQKPAEFSLRLTTDFEGTPRYAALSYCWGGDQPLKTLKSNIDEFRQNIPYDKMPATLQDAARVSSDLGFRYLWIDALCVIQDLDVHEVHTLVAEIPKVYRYAALTIAASSSPRADHGFLNQRDIRDVPEILDTLNLGGGYYECPVQIHDFRGNPSPAMLGLYNHSMAVAPLDLRGWTLQERLLSKRYLLFSDLFTEWTCDESYSHAELLTDGFAARRVGPSGKDLPHRWNTQQALVSRGEQPNYETWHEVVEAYMQRTLSFRKDIPIAISALAKDFGAEHDYAAGLWLSHLCQDLCWRTELTDTFRDNVKMDDAFYAPTWSWWAAQSRISYLWLEYTQPDARFRLLDYTLKLAHPSAPFGYISEASLRIEACCGRVTVNLDMQESQSSSKSGYGIMYGTSGKVLSHDKGFTINWDHPNSIRFGETYLLRIIPLLCLEGEDDPLHCLVVADCAGETQKEQEYHRVGFMFISPGSWSDASRFKDWLKAQPVERLTLV